MTCDGTSTDELIAGDEWVWPYDAEDDISDWSDPVVEFRTGLLPSSQLVASSEDGSVVLDGGFEGTIPATDFDESVFSWWVPAEVTAPVAVSGSVTIYMHARAKVGGVETTVWPPKAYTIRPQVAVRGEEGS